jgi:formylglycine-generating enzyme required for sulfatase activity
MKTTHASTLAFATACASACVILALSGCNTQSGDKANAKPAVEIKRTTTPSGIDMVLIPAGSFAMGSEGGEDDEKPVRTVAVQSFWMDVTEVTQKAYQELMGGTPSKVVGENNPVEQLSWLAAAKYCNMRSMKEGLVPCYDVNTMKCNFDATGYRLPTEAEWEYACRGGSTGPYAFGNSTRRLGDHGWFKKNAGGKPQPVGTKKANAWGLHDMHGNVWEWCNDHYAEDYYARGENADPRGPASGADRVLRGGGFKSSAGACQSSTRFSETPGLVDKCFGYDAYGFRCVRRASAESGNPGR